MFPDLGRIAVTNFILFSLWDTTNLKHSNYMAHDDKDLQKLCDNKCDIEWGLSISIRIVQIKSTCPHFVDVDECSINDGGCSHLCTNLEGGFQCSCPLDYQLQSNGVDCRSKL